MKLKSINKLLLVVVLLIAVMQTAYAQEQLGPAFDDYVNKAIKVSD